MAMDLTTVIQTMPYVQNVAQAELVNPEVHQAVAQVLAQQALAEQNQQTPRIEQQDALSTVQEDRRRRGSGQQQRRRRPRSAPPADTEETQTGNPTPLCRPHHRHENLGRHPMPIRVQTAPSCAPSAASPARGPFCSAPLVQTGGPGRRVDRPISQGPEGGRRRLRPEPAGEVAA